MAKVDNPKKPPGNFRKAFVWSFKPFVNVFAWIGLKEILYSGRQIVTVARGYFVPAPKSELTETFEQTLERLHLSEEDLKKKGRSFLRLTIIFVLISILLLVYAVYIAWSGSMGFGNIGSFLVVIMVSMLALANAFRYHFWWFQVKKRKLGCSFKEWWEDS